MATTTDAVCLVECSEQPLDIAFHPKESNLLAAGLVDGTIEVHDLTELLLKEENPNQAKVATSWNMEEDDDDDEVDTIVSSKKVHSQLIPSKHSELGYRPAVCRSVLFSRDGSTLYAGGSAGDLVGLDASRLCTFGQSTRGATVWKRDKAAYGSGGIQVLHEFALSGEGGHPALLATGDEVGGVRVWDTRLLRDDPSNNPSGPSLKRPPGCVYSWRVHEDYITDLTTSADGYTLLASSADSRMSAYDLRLATDPNQPQDKVVFRSDSQDDELLSIQVIKSGTKVVCGSGEGALSIFSWGNWFGANDHFPGHPSSVDGLVAYDADTLITGSSDGLLRVVQIHPNKLLGILGNHEGFPIEKLRLNANRTFVASISHDPYVRIWDTRILNDDYDHEMDHVEAPAGAHVDVTAMLGKTAKTESDDEWEDMDQSDEEDLSDDDSDEKETVVTKGDRRKQRFKTDREKFYEDL